MAWWLEQEFYPPHLEVANLNHGTNAPGGQHPGRFIICRACGAESNTLTRNGDAKFLRAHRRCAVYGAPPAKP